MTKKGLNLRISDRRLNKLRLYAASQEKTMTHLVEYWIDRLPNPEMDNYSDTSCGSLSSCPAIIPTL
ncbi:hypothetical protein [Microseira sp. BLCC-F43]|uniref:hypothetical protein n=1 Tax=Microseira sp. BLCC-F43 TaxID=3153602 RepID=UPI0035BC5F68